MRRSWHLWTRSGPTTLVWRGESPEGMIVERGSAETLFDLLDDHGSWSALVEIYAELTGTSAAQFASSEAARPLVVARLRDALRHGEILIARPPAYAAPLLVRQQEEEEVDDAPAAPREERSWIQIELVDEDGNPVPRATYRIELPDGSTREGRLDQLGTARVDGIDPGMCRVSFPAIDGSEWRAA